MNWLEALAVLSAEVALFLARNDDYTPDNYQVKWDVLRSALGRRPAGVLRHLPSKTSIVFTSSL